MSTERSSPISQRLAQVQEQTIPVLEFLTQSVWARRKDEPGIADFVVGNPHEMPLPGFVVALRRQLEPRSPGLVRLQVERACGSGVRRQQLERGRPWQRVRSRRHLHDQRRIRRACHRVEDGRRSRRRGHLRQPAVVLLWNPDRGRGRRPGARRGRPNGLRSGRGRHRRGHHAANARHHRQLAQQPDRPHLSAVDAGSPGRRARACLTSATAARSTCCPTRPTAASCSTMRPSTARPRSTRTRSWCTRTASSC